MLQESFHLLILEY